MIAVRVDNAEQPNSRWYSGCGFYRNVWLVKTGDIRVAEWGTYVTATSVDTQGASLKVVTTVENIGTQAAAGVSVYSILKDGA